jgi:hypothetical protein
VRLHDRRRVRRGRRRARRLAHPGMRLAQTCREVLNWKRAVMSQIALTLCSDVQLRAPKLAWPGLCAGSSPPRPSRACRRVSAGRWNAARGTRSAPTRTRTVSYFLPRARPAAAHTVTPPPPHRRALADCDYAAALCGRTDGRLWRVARRLAGAPLSALLPSVGSAAC